MSMNVAIEIGMVSFHFYFLLRFREKDPPGSVIAIYWLGIETLGNLEIKKQNSSCYGVCFTFITEEITPGCDI